MKNDVRTILDFVLADRLRDICERRGVPTDGGREAQRERVARALGGEVVALLPLLVRAELVEFLATRGYAFVSGASREELERLLTMLCIGDPRALDEKPLGSGSPIRLERRGQRVPPATPPPTAALGASPGLVEKVFRSRVQRERGFIYYVKDGDVWAAPSRYGGKKRAPRCVHEAGVVMDHVTYLYYIDADGDIARKRRDRAPLAEGSVDGGEVSPVRVVAIYAQDDRRFLKRLCAELVPYEGRREISLFFDGRITPGAVWESALMTELRRAEVIVLLVSSDFLASRYCMDVEWPLVQRRHARGECEVAPVLVRPCHYGRSPIGAHQLIRPNNLSVDEHPSPHDAAWMEVMRAFDVVIERALGKKRR